MVQYTQACTIQIVAEGYCPCIKTGSLDTPDLLDGRVACIERINEWDLNSIRTIIARSDKVNCLLDFKMHQRKERGRKFERARVTI